MTAVVAPPRPRPTTDSAGTVAVALLTVVTAVGLCRLFPDWAYLRPVLVVVVGVHAAAALLRAVRVPAWIAIPVVLAIALELLSIVYYRDTTRLLLPSGQTLDVIRTDLRLVWQQFPGAVAPVPSTGSFAMATAGLLAVCAALADAFAFRAFGRAEAVVPAGVVFVFTSALGTDRNRIAVSALWIAMAIVTVAVLRFSHSTDDSSWMGTRRRTLASVMPATLACAALVALASGVVAPRLPGAHSGPLFDARNHGNSVTEVLNPLVDIRSRLITQANVEVFTVKSASPAYWRVIALEDFNGTQWTPLDEQLRPATGDLAQVGAGHPLDQQITIKRLGGKLVPTAFSPVLTSTSGLFYASDTQTIIRPDPGLKSGDKIEITSVVADPSVQQLRAATVAHAPSQLLYQLPPGFPQVATQLARSITAGASTPYDKMIALQTWFRSNFTYDLSVQAGHSDDAISNFLRIRRGYCEQFAGTFAAMARVLQIPARVAIGFTPGELGSDGLYHVFDRQAHAWPEVWFDGIGWVSFEPTPGRGQPGTESYTGVPAAQDSSAPSGAPTGGSGPTATAAADAAGPTRISVDASVPTAGGQPTTTTLVAVGESSSGSGGPGLWIAVLLAALLAWVALMPRLARAWGRGRSSNAAERVAASWRRACGVLRLAGAPAVAGATPLEHSAAVNRSTGVDRQLVAELARAVTRATYSPAAVEEAEARRCEQLEQQIDEACHSHIPWPTRLLARLDPRIARQTG
ncbi:MAG: DUF3488 and transglutaminase-like domain-containing protein [Ilumatobacteraceae bacterium]